MTRCAAQRRARRAADSPAVGRRRAGCGASGNDRAREYMPDMARGPAYKAFAPNAATRTGLTLQAPVAGTIARGHQRRSTTAPARRRRRAPGRELANPLPLSAAHDRGRPRPLPDVLPGLPRRERQGRRPAGRRGQDPDAARVHVRPRGAVPARPHLPRRHDGHAEDAVVRGAADARRALEGGRLRQPHAAAERVRSGELCSPRTIAEARDPPGPDDGRAAP